VVFPIPKKIYKKKAALNNKQLQKGVIALKKSKLIINLPMLE
jgi:hypothetical protein